MYSLERRVTSGPRAEARGTPTFKELSGKRKPGCLNAHKHTKQEHQWGYTKGGQKEHLDTLLSLPDVQTLGSVLVPVNSTFLIPGNVSIPQLISGAVSKINP